MFSQNRNPDTLYIIKISINLIEFTYFSILYFRLPKKSISGLPYLRNSSIDNFKISIILLVLVQEYGNLSQKSRKRNSGTFYFQAPCEVRNQIHNISKRTLENPGQRLTLCSMLVCWFLSKWILCSRDPSSLTRCLLPTISAG